MSTLRLGTAVPATAILDGDGALAFRIVGEANDATLRGRLDWLLGDRSSPPPPDLVLPEGITAEHFREHHETGEGDEHHEEGGESGSTVPT